jgi:hypothetical protein
MEAPRPLDLGGELRRARDLFSFGVAAGVAGDLDLGLEHGL